jgi:hypothetical protein
MIYRVSRVFTAGFISFVEFTRTDLPGEVGKRRRDVIRDIAKSAKRGRFELYGTEARDLGELHVRLRDISDQLRKASTKPDEPVPAVLGARAASVTAAAARVTDFANYEFVRRIFRALFPRLAAAGALAAIGVGTYAFQTSQAPPQGATVTKPIAVQLHLNPEASDLQSRLGKGCDLTSVPAVAVGGRLTSPEVITTGGDNCAAIRIELDESDGVAVPSVDGNAP